MQACNHQRLRRSFTFVRVFVDKRQMLMKPLFCRVSGQISSPDVEATFLSLARLGRRAVDHRILPVRIGIKFGHLILLARRHAVLHLLLPDWYLLSPADIRRLSRINISILYEYR